MLEMSHAAADLRTRPGAARENEGSHPDLAQQIGAADCPTAPFDKRKICDRKGDVFIDLSGSATCKKDGQEGRSSHTVGRGFHERVVKAPRLDGAAQYSLPADWARVPGEASPEQYPATGRPQPWPPG